MELQAKLLRAHVWLSQRAVGAQDGFLAVTRVAEHETLAYGSLDDDGQRDAASRKYRSVTLKWAEGEDRDDTKAFQLLQDEEPPKLEFLLFMLQVSAAEKTNKHQQRIVYIGKSVLRLGVRDVDAMRTQHELVFTTTLDGGLGSLDVKLKKSITVLEKQKQHLPESGDSDVDADDARGSFNVNWSSSEALKKDMEEKARLKAEGEKKLLLQLRKVVASALHATKLHDKELRRQRLWWAAAKIQRAFRALLNSRHEARERVRTEQLAAQVAKKARLKEKVVERNLKRAQAMREQLRSFKTGRSSSPDNNNNRSHEVTTNVSTSQSHANQSRFAQIKAERQSMELIKLQRRLAELEAERAEAMVLAQKRRSERRPEAVVSHRHERRSRQQLQSMTADQQQDDALATHQASQSGNALLDTDLVCAIRALHFAQRKW